MIGKFTYVVLLVNLSMVFAEDEAKTSWTYECWVGFPVEPNNAHYRSTFETNGKVAHVQLVRIGKKDEKIIGTVALEKNELWFAEVHHYLLKNLPDMKARPIKAANADSQGLHESISFLLNGKKKMYEFVDLSNTRSPSIDQPQMELEKSNTIFSLIHILLKEKFPKAEIDWNR